MLVNPETCAALAEDIHALEDVYGALPLNTMTDRDKLRIAEAIMGLERVRTRLMSCAQQNGWREVVARDKRLHALSGIRPDSLSGTHRA